MFKLFIKGRLYDAIKDCQTIIYIWQQNAKNHRHGTINYYANLRYNNESMLLKHDCYELVQFLKQNCPNDQYKAYIEKRINQLQRGDANKKDEVLLQSQRMILIKLQKIKQVQFYIKNSDTKFLSKLSLNLN